MTPLKSILTYSILIASAASAFAGTPVQPVLSSKDNAKEESIFDKIWSIPTIYKNDENPYLQELRIVGRAHFDVFSLDSSMGEDSDWIVRRLRIGTKARLFQKLELQVEVDLDPQGPDPLYSRLTQANLAWKFNDAFKLTIGKQSAKFTLDGATSSNETLTTERNNIANNLWFPTQYVTGVSVSGKAGGFQYQTGLFSGGTVSPEFGNMDAGNFFLVSAGYDFGKTIGVKKALLRADYVYNDPNLESNATRNFESVGSLVFVLEEKKWGVSSELTAGVGSLGQSDVWGFAVMPWYNITENLQIVGRYTYMDSEDVNGIRFNRYDNVLAGSRRGDEYSEFYAGLNYYIYGHKLKLMTGFTFTDMQDSANDGGEYNGWTWTTGLRISW